MRKIWMNYGVVFLALLVLWAGPSSAQETQEEILQGRDDIASVDEDDPQMNSAIAQAQRTVSEFLDIVTGKPAGISDIAFKFPLESFSV